MRAIIFSVVALLIFSLHAAQAEEKTIELKVGTNTALADLVTPDDGSIKDGVVLITHGTMAHKDMELIDAIQTALAEQGVASLAHTLTLGEDSRKGMFPCDKMHTHLHENALNEINAWIKWLETQGAGPITLMGHSRGGAQAAAYLKQAAKQDHKLVLLASMTSGYLQRQESSFQEKHGKDLNEFVKKSAALVKADKGSEILDLPGFLHCAKSKVSAQTFYSYYGPEAVTGSVEIASALPAPVLIIAGSKDTVVPDLAEKAKKIANGKNRFFELIEDADHFFLDFYAEDAAEKIASFVQQ